MKQSSNKQFDFSAQQNAKKGNLSDVKNIVEKPIQIKVCSLSNGKETQCDTESLGETMSTSSMRDVVMVTGDFPSDQIHLSGFKRTRSQREDHQGEALENVHDPLSQTMQGRKSDMH